VRPRLLDLFCGAGGASAGFHFAGFDVVGVDIAPQPNYPFEFVQADALDVLEQVVDGCSDGPVVMELGFFDAVHASPPCQFHTDMQAIAGNQGAHQELIDPIRELLEQTGLPYVIENVEGAKPYMQDPFRLCGSSFGLGVHKTDNWEMEWRELRRHRLFETNWPIGLVPTCGHMGRSVGIYGDHLRWGRRSTDGEVSGPEALELGRVAMGINWMTWPELVEAIPPSYTEWIGRRLISRLAEQSGEAA